MKNRELRVRLAKTDKNVVDDEQTPNTWTPTDISDAVVSTVERLGRSALAGIILLTAAKTLSEIAINAAPKKH